MTCDGLAAYIEHLFGSDMGSLAVSATQLLDPPVRAFLAFGRVLRLRGMYGVFGVRNEVFAENEGRF